MSANETALQQNMTAAFIAADPTSVTLTSRSRTRTASGGWQNAPHFVRAEQTFKIIPTREDADPVRTPDGVEHVVEFVLLGASSAAIEVGDTFDYNGNPYEVVGFMPYLLYEIRALVARHGG